jgi:hypothetical protein
MQRPRIWGLELGGLRGLGLRGLEFKSLISNPSVLNSRPGLGGSGPEMFLDFDFPRLRLGVVNY